MSRRAASREAHQPMLPAAPHSPGSPHVHSTPSWSPFLDPSEAGHNEELAHRGATLLLRGSVHGVMTTLLLQSLGDAASWQPDLVLQLNLVALLGWAAYSGCNEALEAVTYGSYYKRERAREAWGERSKRGTRSPAPRHDRPHAARR